MGADEQMVRGGWFARLQGEVFRLGVPVGTDLAGLRDVCAFMCEAAGREAVEAATLFVTERDIAEALENWAGDERAAGRLANWARLCGIAQEVRAAAQSAGAAEIKALVKLPPEAEQLPGPVGVGIRERTYRVGRMIAPTVKTSLVPLNRLVAEVAQEAYRAGLADGQAMRAAAASTDEAGEFTTLQGTGNWPDPV